MRGGTSRIGPIARTLSSTAGLRNLGMMPPRMGGIGQARSSMNLSAKANESVITSPQARLDSMQTKTYSRTRAISSCKRRITFGTICRCSCRSWSPLPLESASSRRPGSSGGTATQLPKTLRMNAALWPKAMPADASPSASTWSPCSSSSSTWKPSSCCPWAVVYRDLPKLVWFALLWLLGNGRLPRVRGGRALLRFEKRNSGLVHR